MIARTLRGAGATKVALLTDHPVTDGGDAFDAILQRTYVPQKLLALLEPVIAGLGDESARRADGRPARVELAAIGRRLEEPLWDLLNLTTA